MKNTVYVVITPVRDEEKHIEKTIQSMANQSIVPRQWVIVDDGSRDATGAIIDSYAQKHHWITVIHRKDRGFRKNGGGVIEAFNEGYAAINGPDFDFIVKLDGDLSFDSDYFERCFDRFAADPKLGVGGGIVANQDGDRLVIERNPRFHVRGATKIYRAACWRDIDHLIVAPGWDTLDEVKANMHGWHTESFDDLRCVQLKTTGSADGAWKNSVKNGLANYIAGYHPLFMLMKCVRRITQFPWVISSIGYGWGFCSGYLKKIPKVDEPDLIRYLRKEQVKKLMLKKSIWE